MGDGAASTSPAGGASTFARLLDRQRESWRRGEPLLVEDLLREAPETARNPEALLDLIYGEIRLRSERSEAEPFAALARRFPEHAGAILDLAAVHAAVAGDSAAAPRALLGGKYRVLGELGRGGQGVVYRALDTLLLREVAVKVLPDAAFADPEDAARLLDEARALAALDHPHIVRIHEAAVAEGSVTVVLELVQGRDLGCWLREAAGPLPVRWVTEVARQVALALSRIHAQGLAHGDVKPANILIEAPDLESPPHAKLSDLGLARRATIPFPGARTGPEADVYNLGLVLREALTGRLDGEGTMPAAADPRLGRILRGMLRPEPRRRLQAEHVARALALVSPFPEAAGAPVPEPPPAALKELPPGDQRLLARLAVRESPFRLDAAEDLLAGLTEDSGAAVARLLASGALRQAVPGTGSGARLSLGDGWREAARRRAVADGAWDESRRRHFEHVFDLALRASLGLSGSAPARWLRWFEEEMPDLEAALAFALEAGELEAGVELATRLSRAYSLSGRGGQERAWILRFLRRGREAIPAAARSRAWLTLSYLALGERRWNAARRACRRALRMPQPFDAAFLGAVLINLAAASRHLDRHGALATETCRWAVKVLEEFRLPALEASAHETRGLIAFDLGRLAEAGEAFARAHALFRDGGHADACARALLNRARVAQAHGQLELAKVQAAEAAGLAREAGLRQAEAWAHNNLGAVEADLADPAVGKEGFETALILFNAAGDARGAAVAWNNLGWADWFEGHLEDARACFATSREKLASTNESPPAVLLLNEARLAIAERRLDEAAARIDEALSRHRRLPDRLGLLSAIEVLCELEVARGRHETAARLAGAAEAAREALGAPRPGWMEARHAGVLAPSREGLGEEGWRRAWAEGRGLGLEVAAQDRSL